MNERSGRNGRSERSERSERRIESTRVNCEVYVRGKAHTYEIML